jgi:hypothetical protein
VINYLFHFFIGGGTIALVIFMTDHLETKYAALAYVFPVKLSMIMIITHSRHGLSTVTGLAKETSFGLLLTILFIAVIALTAPRVGFWIAFGAAILSFCGGGWLFLRYL